jgi:hypothetical protein
MDAIAARQGGNDWRKFYIYEGDISLKYLAAVEHAVKAA